MAKNSAIRLSIDKKSQRELELLVKGIESKVVRPSMRVAIRSSLKIIQREIIKNARNEGLFRKGLAQDVNGRNYMRTGALKNNIVIRMFKSNKRRGNASVAGSVRYNTVKRKSGQSNAARGQYPWYAHWVNYGVRSRDIPAREFFTVNGATRNRAQRNMIKVLNREIERRLQSARR